MTRNQTLEMFPIGDPAGRRILFDPISAAVGIGGIASNLIGASQSAKAAKQAAEGQAAAADAAGKKVEGAVVDANGVIVKGAANASDMALRSAGGVLDSAKGAAAGVNTAVTGANHLLDPYAAAGSAASDTLSAGLAAGGDFNRTPTAADIQMDPGFAARLKASTDTINRSAAARGGAASGTALMDLNNYAQTSASAEYDNAFRRFETSTQNRFGNLNTVAARGVTAAADEGTNLIGGAKYGGDITTDASKVNLGANEWAGGQTSDAARIAAANTIHGADESANYLTQGANATAAGKIGSANAWAAGLSGAANAGLGAFAIGQQAKQPNYMQRPSSAPYYSGTTTNPDGSLTVHR